MQDQKQNDQPGAPSRACDAALPVVVVELKRLRKKDGTPLCVACEFLDEEVMLDVTQAMPGYVPKQVDTGATDRVAMVREVLKYAPPLIERGTYLLDEQGNEVRPAFHFSEATRVPGSIPGRYLSVTDKALLFNTLMQVSGYAGGAADAVRFHGGDREGRANGVGTVDGGAGDGTEAGRPPVRDARELDAPDGGVGG